MSESRACAHPGCAGSARKGSDYCCNAHKQAAWRKRNKQPVTDPSVTVAPVTDGQGGTIGPVDERSSSTGDPRDTESGMERAITASAKLVADEANTSQCFQDSGIPLPGDPGYKGVCLPDANGRWLLDSHRQRLTHAEERMRYAHV